jgi:hypothetical protein
VKRVAIAALVAALVSSCGGGATDTVNPPPPPPSPAGTTIGPSGGTVTSSDGNAVLTFPAGALSSNLAITTAVMTDPPTSPGLISALAYDFGPTGSQFAQPVTIKLTYQPSQIPVGFSPVFLRLFVRNGSAWDSVPGSTVDTVAHTITGTTTHFSGFAPCPLNCPGTSLNPRVGVDFNPSCCVTMQPGGSGSIAGYVGVLYYAGGITLTPENLPAGVTATVVLGNPSAPCNTGCVYPANVSIFASSAAIPGEYDVALHLSTNVAQQDSVALIPVLITVIPADTLTVAPSTVSIAQGGSAGATVTIARANYTAPINLSVANLPSGVTASFNPAQLTGSTLTSALTFTAGQSVAAGTSNITITAVAAGLTNKTASVALTVSAFSMAGTPPSASVAPGGTTSTGIKVTRAGGFAGTITYSTSGLPAGLTASVTPTSVADSSQLLLTATAGLAAGPYQFNVIATSGTTTAQAVITVTVATSSAIRLDFSQCSVKPVWFAYQDGNGPWTQLVGVGNVYNLPTFASGKGGIAQVSPTQGGPGFGTGVAYMTQAEFTVGPTCSPAALTSTGTVSGLVTGFSAEFADVSLGQASTTAGNGSYTIGGITSGTHDLVAYLQRTSGDRIIIDRGISGGGVLPALDFTPGTGGSPVATAQLTVNGGPGSTPAALMSYITGNCEAGTMYFTSTGVGGSTQITGVPPSLQAAGDLHSLQAIEFTGAVAQEVTTMFHTLANTTVTLGSIIAPTVSVVPGPYKRLQGVLTLPTDYNYVNFSITFPSGNHQSLNTTSAYNGAGPLTLVMPDFSSVPGFSTSWEAGTGETASYVLNATSVAPSAARQCGEGLTTHNAYITGSN